MAVLPPLPSRERAGVRVGGSLRNALQDTVGVREHVVVPEAQHAKALTFEDCRAALVFLDSRRVLATVELDDQTTLQTAEIHYVGTDRVLATELHTEKASIAEREPKATLRQRLVSSRAAATFLGFLCMS
jgi:hypothetical protein